VLERLRKPWSDRRAELSLGAVSLLVTVVVPVRSSPLRASPRTPVAVPLAVWAAPSG